jgi:hypothetical protein
MSIDQHIDQSSAGYLLLLLAVFDSMSDNGYDFGVEEEVAEVCLKRLKWSPQKYAGHMERLYSLEDMGFSWDELLVNGTEPVTQIYYDGPTADCEAMHAKVLAAVEGVA